MRWDGWYGWLAMRSTMYIRTLHNESLEKMSCGCGACNGSCLFFFFCCAAVSRFLRLYRTGQPARPFPSFPLFVFLFPLHVFLLFTKTNKGRNATRDTLTKDSEKGVRERAG
ncbi:hypothetical protein K457DRAFT_751111 [Linnemannia elongata AG-77]|uniref:Uncharacterized protein n=1 Tax=Linnemannia elongata AG-77 TaxID=1314771 RepID=A0A197JKW8_9FUNG|nr:hypothetical protein K457DRAFT_751111 [Linnemannia elongata AG-77]